LTYTTVPLNLAGPTDQVFSKQQDHQLTQNYYVYLSEAGPALQGTPGTTLYSATVTDGKDRGWHVFNSELYTVSGSLLERVAEGGTRTTIGTVPGTGRCIFDDDGVSMFLTTSGKVYRYERVFSTFIEIVGGGHERPNSVTYLNDQFIYDGFDNRFGVSDVGNGAVIESFNYATAESNPDNTSRVYSFGERLYVMCLTSIETWWNSGDGEPPFQKIDLGLVEKGLGSIYSVSNTDSFMYFFGDDLNIYQLKGSQVNNISNAGITKEINAFNGTNDAIGFCFNLQGQDFYYITFPSGDKSYLYAENTGLWTSMAFGVDGGRHLATSYAYVYGKHLVSDRRNGRVLEWDLDINQDNGAVIQRRRVLPNISGELLGKPGDRLMMKGIDFTMQKGVGIPSGQGEDPIIMVEISLDGSETWNPIQNLRFGRGGEFAKKVRADKMASFYDASVRLTTSDPVFSSLRSAGIDIQLAGW